MYDSVLWILFRTYIDIVDFLVVKILTFCTNLSLDCERYHKAVKKTSSYIKKVGRVGTKLPHFSSFFVVIQQPCNIETKTAVKFSSITKLPFNLGRSDKSFARPAAFILHCLQNFHKKIIIQEIS